MHNPARILLIRLLDLRLQLDQLVRLDRRSRRSGHCVGCAQSALCRAATRADEELALDPRRDGIRHLIDDKRHNVERAVVFQRSADQRERTGEVAAEIDRRKLTGIRCEFGKLCLIAYGDIMRVIGFAPDGNLERALNVVDCSACQNRTAVAHLFDDAVCDACRDDCTVVAHRHILLACAQLHGAAEDIIRKCALFHLHRVFAAVRRDKTLSGMLGTLKGAVNGADFLLRRVKIRDFLLVHRTIFGVCRLHKIFHDILQFGASFHQFLKIHIFFPPYVWFLMASALAR